MKWQRFNSSFDPKLIRDIERHIKRYPKKYTADDGRISRSKFFTIAARGQMLADSLGISLPLSSRSVNQKERSK